VGKRLPIEQQDADARIAQMYRRRRTSRSRSSDNHIRVQALVIDSAAARFLSTRF
jgi:hypothetical protein